MCHGHTKLVLGTRRGCATEFAASECAEERGCSKVVGVSLSFKNIRNTNVTVREMYQKPSPISAYCRASALDVVTSVISFRVSLARIARFVKNAPRGDYDYLFFLREVLPLCISNLYNILCTVSTRHTSRQDAIITIRLYLATCFGRNRPFAGQLRTILRYSK